MQRRHSRTCFSFFLDADRVAPSLRSVRHPRHQRPGPQPGEVRVRHIGASPLLGQRPGHFILTIINLQNVCVYATHCPANIFNFWAHISSNICFLFRLTNLGEKYQNFAPVQQAAAEIQRKVDFVVSVNSIRSIGT